MIKNHTPRRDLKYLFINSREQEIDHTYSEIDYEFERTMDIECDNFLEKVEKEDSKKADKNYKVVFLYELEEHHLQNNSDEEMKSGDSIPYINE